MRVRFAWPVIDNLAGTRETLTRDFEVPVVVAGMFLEPADGWASQSVETVTLMSDGTYHAELSYSGMLDGDEMASLEAAGWRR